MNKENNSYKEALSESRRKRRIKEMYKDNLDEMDEESEGIIDLLYRMDRDKISNFLSNYEDYMLNRLPAVMKFIEYENLAESIALHRKEHLANMEESKKNNKNS